MIKCCHGCETRSVGCHSVCQAYIDESRIHAENMAKKRKFDDATSAGIESMTKVKNFMYRTRRK